MLISVFFVPKTGVSMDSQNVRHVQCTVNRCYDSFNQKSRGYKHAMALLQNQIIPCDGMELTFMLVHQNKPALWKSTSSLKQAKKVRIQLHGMIVTLQDSTLRPQTSMLQMKIICELMHCLHIFLSPNKSPAWSNDVDLLRGEHGSRKHSRHLVDWNQG